MVPWQKQFDLGDVYEYWNPCSTKGVSGNIHIPAKNDRLFLIQCLNVLDKIVQPDQLLLKDDSTASHRMEREK